MRAGVWTSDQALPPASQGLVVLGTPLGRDEFVQQHLSGLRARHEDLPQRISQVPNVQAAWLLQLLCAYPRCNYATRVLQ